MQIGKRVYKGDINPHFQYKMLWSCNHQIEKMFIKLGEDKRKRHLYIENYIKSSSL